MFIVDLFQAERIKLHKAEIVKLLEHLARDLANNLARTLPGISPSTKRRRRSPTTFAWNAKIEGLRSNCLQANCLHMDNVTGGNLTICT